MQLLFVVVNFTFIMYSLGIQKHSIQSVVKVYNRFASQSTRIPFFYNDVFEVSLPSNHRFPMEKYRMVRLALQDEFADKKEIEFHESPLANFEELTSTHCPTYVNRYLTGLLNEQEVRKTGFPWSLKHVKRSTSSVGGTVAAMRAVLGSDDVLASGHIAGGTHHAFYNYGEGFCIFSDIAVAANLALKEYPRQVQQIVIIDLDVHQGNGNAVLFQHNPAVFTFSMHCKENYFSTKQASDVDVELGAGAGDAEYLALLRMWLPRLLDQLQPQLVFVQAGVDVFQHDKLGKLTLTREGLQARNDLVFDCLRHSESNAKTVVTMGGGYPKDLNPHSPAFQEIVQCHADVYRSCVKHFLLQ